MRCAPSKGGVNERKTWRMLWTPRNNPASTRLHSVYSGRRTSANEYPPTQEKSMPTPIRMVPQSAKPRHQAACNASGSPLRSSCIRGNHRAPARRIGQRCGATRAPGRVTVRMGGVAPWWPRLSLYLEGSKERRFVGFREIEPGSISNLTVIPACRRNGATYSRSYCHDAGIRINRTFICRNS